MSEQNTMSRKKKIFENSLKGSGECLMGVRMDSVDITEFYTDMFRHFNLRELLYYWALDVYAAEWKYGGMFLPVEKKGSRCLVR
jgi:hypothetical protein